jgi:alpha-ketoglutarate-dependent taurine dioxygenase
MNKMLNDEIVGPQAWVRNQLRPSDWLVPFPPKAIAEIEAVIKRIDAENDAIEDLRPDQFDLPTCIEVMEEVRRRLLGGGGLAVVDHVPVERFSTREGRAIGWLLACTLGQVVDQKWEGGRIYDVKDSGKKLGYGVRRSITNLDQPFHTDGGWLWKPPAFVGLFCLESAPSGGMSRFTSLITAHNTLRRQNPQLLARLYQPFAWDRQSEHPADAARFAMQPVFEEENGVLAARYYEDYVHKGQGLADRPLDDTGRAALLALRGIVDDPDHWIEFRIERGQFQYINNRQFAHSRTAFEDAPDASRSRHMLRLWNRDEGTPHLEGRGFA